MVASALEVFEVANQDASPHESGEQTPHKGGISILLRVRARAILKIYTKRNWLFKPCYTTHLQLMFYATL